MQLLLLGSIVLLSHAVEGATGFGCMILALPFVSALLGLKVAVPVLVLLSTLFDLALVAKDIRKINWRVAAKIVLLSALFMPLGFFALRSLPEVLLMRLLGAFILMVAVLGIVQSFGAVQKPVKLSNFVSSFFPPNKRRASKWTVLFLPLAGLVQGAFGGSGPFMVIYAQTVLKDKTEFRATMAFVWVLLNAVNLTQYGAGGMLTAEVFHTAALLVPFIAVGFALGIWIHKCISQDKFSKLIYCILFVTGMSMML